MLRVPTLHPNAPRAERKRRRPRHGGFVRLGVVLPAAVMAQVRATARHSGKTLRRLVLEALSSIGIAVPANTLPGLPGYDREPGTGPQLCVHLPVGVMRQLVRLQARRRCARRTLVLEALQILGIAVAASDIVPDRRKGVFRTPRGHYARHAQND